MQLPHWHPDMRLVLPAWPLQHVPSALHSARHWLMTVGGDGDSEGGIGGDTGGDGGGASHVETVPDTPVMGLMPKVHSDPP